ncbi:hypothetical protein FVQ98_16055 [Ottowia sp. GY511]|nr:hypothetical protein [Ottowia sp. GY511]TXK24785.1 hypothetical protein FVQ98_16055 [Ottowia sp. GY511]
MDEFQVLMDGSDVCLGSVGIVVESPAGTKSILKMPLDHLGQEQVKDFTNYGLGSYAFYGERAWTVEGLRRSIQPDALSHRRWGRPQLCCGTG